MKPPSRRASWWRLAGLACGVMLAHAALLQTGPAWLERPGPARRSQATGIFLTRSVAAAPVLTSPSVSASSPASSSAVSSSAKPVMRQTASAWLAPHAQPARAAVAQAPEAAPPAPPVLPVDTSPAISLANSPDTPPVTSSPAPPLATPPAAAAAGAAVRVAVPAALRLQYTIRGQARRLPYSVSGELRWWHDGSQYQAQFEAGAPLLGTRLQTSVGDITPEGLAPIRFGDRSRSELAAHFERDKGQISFSANTPDTPLEPGAQDRLSVLLQLGALLAGEPARYPRGSRITLQVAGARDAASWQFEVEGEETLALPLGELATVKLRRSPRGEYDQQVELWLAPALGYLPARLRLSQASGDFADQQLRATAPP